MRSTATRAFTLIELLIVILIIAILIAIAVPSFLNQQQKAQNSAAEQSLAVAYKDAKADMASSTNSNFPSYTTLAADIAADEPQYQVGTAIFSSDQPVVSGTRGEVWVLLGSTGSNGAIASTSGQNLYLADVSKSGAVCTLTVTNDGPPQYAGCGGSSSGTAGSASAASAATPVPTAAPNLSQTTNLIPGSVTISTDNGSWANSPSNYTYQWQRSSDGTNWTNIVSATTSSYAVQSADAGDMLRVLVSASNAAGQGTTADTSAITSTVPASAQANYASTILGQTPTAFYEMQSGSPYADASGHQVGLNQSNVTSIASGPFSGASAAYFNGNAYFSAASFALANTSFSLEMWIATNDTSGTDWIGGEGTAQSKDNLWEMGFNNYGNPDEAATAFWGDTTAFSSTTTTSGVWQQLTFTYDNSAKELYVYSNGVLVGSAATSNGLQSTANMLIGKLPTYNIYFTGSIADYSVWVGTALSRNTILSQCQAASGNNGSTC